MAKILVQIPFSARCLPSLKQIAKVCRAQGHQIRYWLGPLSGWLPNRLWAGQPDLAFIWNGVKPRYLPSIRLLRDLGAQVVYVEHGWYPQSPTVQMDRIGINAGASWAAKPLLAKKRTSLPVREQGDLLLVLQHDQDVQLTEYSPWFANMDEFVAHVVTHSALPVRVRPHPRHPPSPALKEFVLSQGHTWDDSPSLNVALTKCRAMACINSSSAIEALSQQLPVLCFGDAIYRHPGAVYCLDDQPEGLRTATAELAQCESSLFVEPIQAALERVHANQFVISELNQHLPALVDRWLAERQDTLDDKKWGRTKTASARDALVPTARTIRRAAA